MVCQFEDIAALAGRGCATRCCRAVEVSGAIKGETRLRNGTIGTAAEEMYDAISLGGRRGTQQRCAEEYGKREAVSLEKYRSESSALISYSPRCRTFPLYCIA